jgi:hypothetical protein
MSFRQFFDWKSDLRRLVFSYFLLKLLIPDKVNMPRGGLDDGGWLVRWL